MKKNSTMDTLVLILQVSINMIVPILVMTFIGAWIGKKIDMNWISVVFFFLGAAGGASGVYKLLKKYLKKQKEPYEIAREKELEEQNDKEN